MEKFYDLTGNPEHCVNIQIPIYFTYPNGQRQILELVISYSTLWESERKYAYRLHYVTNYKQILFNHTQNYLIVILLL